MINLTQLTPNSTLRQLPNYNFQVSATTLGWVVTEKFGQNPDLPGVIIADDSQMLGMISRLKFREQMSLPDREAIYQKRPIRDLLDFIRIPPLLLSEDWKIDEAAQTALNRAKELVYEPIIVVLEDHTLRLLDVQVLLLAQAQILSFVKKAFYRQKLESQKYLEVLKQEQAKAKEYTELLTTQNAIFNKAVHQTNQAEILQQSQAIAQLNQRFFRIGQLLSVELRKSFQATLTNTETISRSNDKIAATSRTLSTELEAVNRWAKQIGEILEQIRYLGVQLTVCTNQSDTQSNSLSKVNAEIGRLVNQTMELEAQMEKVTSRFKTRMQELTESAKSSSNAARSVIGKIEKSSKMAGELEALVCQPSPNLVPVIHEQPNQVDIDMTLALMQKIEQAEATLSELEHLTHDPMASSLIHKIEQKLKKSRQDLTE